MVAPNKESGMSESERDIETRIQRRAYELWEEAGRPEGRGDARLSNAVHCTSASPSL
jgi:hypothetical protein